MYIRVITYIRYCRSGRLGTDACLHCRVIGRASKIWLCRTTNRLLPEKGAATSSIELATSLPPRYVDFKEQLRTEMFTIKQKMSELRQLHGRAALTSFDDSDSNEAQIEVLTQEITRLFKRGEAKLQQFTSGPADSEADEKVTHSSLAYLRSF